jgi:hypothetical protein
MRQTIGATLLLLAVAVSVSFGADNSLGTWKLNVEKSRAATKATGNEPYPSATRISPAACSEALREEPLVKASGSGWNAEAMHHVDAHQIAKGRWIAAVDALGK